MFEFEPRKLRKIGIIGGAGVALVSGVASLALAIEAQKTQDEQRTAIANEDPKAKQYEKDLGVLVPVSAVSGVIFLGSLGAVGASAVSVYTRRRRSEPA